MLLDKPKGRLRRILHCIQDCIVFFSAGVQVNTADVQIVSVGVQVFFAGVQVFPAHLLKIFGNTCTFCFYV